MYNVRRQAGKTVIALNGELDVGHRNELRRALDGVGDPEVVVDLAAVKYIDSTIVNELLKLCKVKKRCSFILVRRGLVARILELLQLDTILEIAYVDSPEHDESIAWIPLRTG